MTLDGAAVEVAVAARRRALVVAAGLVAAAFVAKIGYELTTASTVFVEAAGMPVPLAHVIGAVGGLLCGATRSSRDGSPAP